MLVYIVTEINNNQRIELSLKNHIYKLKNHYKVLLNQQSVTADIAHDFTVKDPKVVSILSKALNTNNEIQQNKLRNELDTLLSSEYKRLVKRGVLQYQFVFPDNKSFFRFHKKTKFGDDLSKTRHDFKYVNETKKILRGFSQGKTVHAFRNIYPVFDKNKKHLGAVEISFTSEYLQDNLTHISHIHTHFLVKKSVFSQKSWNRDDLVIKYIQSIEHDKYMINMPKSHTKEEYTKLLNEKITKIKEPINKNIPLGKEFAIYFVDKNQNIEVISFLPIYNNTNMEVAAWIVSYEKDNFISITLQNTLGIRAILFLILLILFYFIYKTLKQKDNLAEIVTIKTNDLKELNESLEQKIIIEVEKSKEIESKLFQSEKMVSMGEMIGNIAHQWRQPLSAISTGATGMLVQKEYGVLSDEDFKYTCNSINKHAQYLSQTIDDFRNYIKGDREKKVFTLKNDIDSFLHLIEGSIRNESINIVIDIDETISIEGYPNELVQCLINIYNNAKDAFNEQKVQTRYLFISSKEIENNIQIIIKDNAGGIPKNIITKIFEPYFTTKNKKQGTGLGLHMTYTLIIEGMLGNIEVYNSSYTYKNDMHNGAEFIITLPL
ncbi:HAMP domain-containing sensor histidine kinase [Arcobacteraceae bacterium]|nr:HAMP domain-containing sensor histidine kinase [Arcobacteraceae bacterium]